jgi:hypothetical protein
MKDTSKKKIIQAITEFNDACEKVKNCWFWSDNGNARIRSGKDKYYSCYKEFVYKGEKYECSLEMDFRRNNVYKNITVLKNGEKYTRIIFRKILKELETKTKRAKSTGKA